MSPRGKAVSNKNYLSSSEARVGIRRWKLNQSEQTWCQESIGGIRFTNKWRAASLSTSSEFDYFKPMLKHSILKCISWLNDSLFGRGRWGFLTKEGFKTFWTTLRSPLNSVTFFSVCTIYSLWSKEPKPGTHIDYRCDDEKKVSSWGDILVSLRSWRLHDSKNAGHSPSPSTCLSATQKNYPAWIVNPQPLLLRICLFW